MKLTKTKLKQIIKEEIEAVLNEDARGDTKDEVYVLKKSKGGYEEGENGVLWYKDKSKADDAAKAKDATAVMALISQKGPTAAAGWRVAKTYKG